MTEQIQEPMQNCKAPADHLLKVVDLGPPQQPQKKVSNIFQSSFSIQCTCNRGQRTSPIIFIFHYTLLMSCKAKTLVSCVMYYRHFDVPYSYTNVIYIFGYAYVTLS